mmetsp:Transcript_59577/g.98807  ORF Transcript_59577/g.98807 Transcript_59577/m.98807 type:complete len:213 (-) Transcript_59577:300-938(-)
MKRAVTMFEACALKPPTAPASEEPIRFFAVLSATTASTVVFSTRRTTSPLIVASTTTEQPLPSIQLIAAAFLSQHMFPLNPRTCMSSNSLACRESSTALTPFDTIFIPIASPVLQQKRAYAYFPATVTRTVSSLAKRDVVAKVSCALAKFAGASSQLRNCAALIALGKHSTGARLIACCMTTADAPLDSVIALQPRRVDAMRAPSTVASGTW